MVGRGGFSGKFVVSLKAAGGFESICCIHSNLFSVDDILPELCFNTEAKNFFSRG